MDEELEALIDRVGRAAVFSRARALGWSQGNAPKWVWRNIALEIERGVPPPHDSRPLHEQVLGLRLF